MLIMQMPPSFSNGLMTMNWLFWRLFNADFLLAAQGREGRRVCKYNKCHVTQININKIQVKSCNVGCIISMNLW